MKKLSLSFAFALCAVIGMAQSIDLGVKIDLKTGIADPIVSTPVMEFDSILGLNVQSSILAFAGSRIEDGRIVGGGAWVITRQIAQGSRPLTAYLGPSVEFAQGQPMRFGFVVGVRL